MVVNLGLGRTEMDLVFTVSIFGVLFVVAGLLVVLPLLYSFGHPFRKGRAERGRH